MPLQVLLDATNPVSAYPGLEIRWELGRSSECMAA